MTAVGTEEIPVHSHKIGVLRLTLTGAIAMMIIFALCWAGTFVPFSGPTHAFIPLFTPAPIGSIPALIEGSCWSFLFGGVSGAVVALTYNLFAPMQPT